MAFIRYPEGRIPRRPGDNRLSPLQQGDIELEVIQQRIEKFVRKIILHIQKEVTQNQKENLAYEIQLPEGLTFGYEQKIGAVFTEALGRSCSVSCPSHGETCHTLTILKKKV
ncbi:MAG: hypothetical protein H7A36_05940 [Chlamydiales bacterium]|nr:hypothetical protein [Chlamydiales bacterium]